VAITGPGQCLEVARSYSDTSTICSVRRSIYTSEVNYASAEKDLIESSQATEACNQCNETAGENRRRVDTEIEGQTEKAKTGRQALV
jgi:hypothetical protein